KLDAVKNGVACFLSSCRHEFTEDYYESASHRFCNETCVTQYQNEIDIKTKEASDKLRELKRKEMETLAVTNTAICNNWTDAEVARHAHNIVNTKIRPILEANPNACVYPVFAASYRQQQESTAFLTQRGGSYQSTSRDGSLITGSQLWNAGFQRMVLYEQRNWVNMAALEKKMQQIIALEFGRRLFRNYFGGGRPAKDGEQLNYGVYLTYNAAGYGDFVLCA
ncbi:UNVERIFIED_CONTAM: hypothetical protein HDU68_006335, partial [Siphonaria sp. JEL0065]